MDTASYELNDVAVHIEPVVLGGNACTSTSAPWMAIAFVQKFEAHGSEGVWKINRRFVGRVHLDVWQVLDGTASLAVFKLVSRGVVWVTIHHVAVLGLVARVITHTRWRESRARDDPIDIPLLPAVVLLQGGFRALAEDSK